MRITKVLTKTAFISLFVLLFVNSVQANSIFPYKKEVMISNQERTREKISFKNDGKKDILISPVVYSYNPQTLELIETEGYIFVRTDKEIFTVKPNHTITIDYEIVPPTNLEIGTYFNLIVLETQAENTFLRQTNPISVTDSLSHLIVLHIIDSESAVYGITSEFAQVNLEVTQKGIPFIRPAKVKLVYQNITNYVLTPMGEMQIYNKKGKYSPIYFKINEEEKKLYPGGIIEEEVTIEKAHLSDLFNERTVIARFYNGIDENFILKETSIQPNYILLIVAVIFVISLLILIRSLFEIRKKSKKKIVKP
jgi:hypothetical protein